MSTAIRKHLAVRFVIALLVGALLAPASVLAQQGTSPSNGTAPGDQQQTPANTNNDEQSSSKSATTPAPSLIPDQLQVQALGKTSYLSRDRSSLQYGPVYVDSMWYFFVVGNGLRIDPTTNRLGEGTNTANVLRTNVAFDHLFGRNRFTVQYQPRLAILNGQVQRDFSSHALGVDGSHMFNPRWSLSFNNSYSYRQGRLLYGDSFVDVDAASGNALRTPFVETGTRFVSDTTRALLTYRKSARDEFSLEPRFDYSRASFAATPTSGYTYVASLNWSHALSETRGFGLSYSWGRRLFTGSLSNAAYQAIGASYSQQFGQTWRFRTTLAAGSVADRAGREWTVTGSMAVLKYFRRSLAAITYYRGDEFGGVLTNRFTDRGDASYAVRLTGRWGVSGGGGYFRAPRNVGTVTGYYATTQVSYALSPRLSWVAIYGYKWQAGPTTDLLFTGSRSYFATGLRWDARQQ